MLSISAPMRGGGLADYYLDLATEDYYLDGGEPPGHWVGEGAALLGLTGQVGKEQLQQLLLGFHPETHEPLVQNAGVLNRQSGWDLTFSAPKSVSVLWAMAAPAMREEIQAAQQVAVEAGLAYLQEVAGFTRRGKGGTELERTSLVAATFEHGTSRAMDPQLHTHALLLNLGQRADGTTGTIQSQDIFQHKMAAGAMYRTELAHQLQQRLGVAVEPVRTWFEVKGITKELCREFSKRRQDIERVLKERGLDNAVAAKVAALDTRHKKGHVARGELFKGWQATGEKFNWSLKPIPAQRGKPALSKPTKAQAQKLIFDAVARLTYHENVFSGPQLMRQAAELAQGRGFDAKAVFKAVSDYVKSDHCVEVGKIRKQKVYTTREMLELEKDLLRLIDKANVRNAHEVPIQQVNKALKRAPGLSEEQRKAIKILTAHAGSVKALSGLAGTGKTSTLATARQIWERQGFRVIGASLSGKAARGLEEGAGIQSATIFKTLKDLRAGIQVGIATTKPFARAPSWNPLSKLEIPFIQLRVSGARMRLDEKSVLVVDEAGMVGTRQMKDLVDCVMAANAKLVLVGDAKQLQPIHAGAPFRTIAERVNGAKLTDIRRQHDPQDRDVVRKFLAGKATEALKDLVRQKRVAVAKTKQGAIERLLVQWRRRGMHQPEHNLILAAKNETVNDLNRQAQKARWDARLLSVGSIKVGNVRIHEGDRVLFTRNARNLGVNNGTLGTVEELGVDWMRVRLDDGKMTVVPTRVYSDIRLGYAVTTHKAQGATTENTFVLVEELNQNRELTYVQASRGRESTRFFTDEATAGEDLEDLAKKMAESRPKVMVHDLMAEREAEAAKEQQVITH